jgi:hypothetical protein
VKTNRRELLLVAVVSSVLTALLLGGGVAVAFNVPNDSVTSAKIIDNAVRSRDIRNGTVGDVDLGRRARSYWAIVQLDGSGVPTIVGTDGANAIFDNSVGSFGLTWNPDIENCAVTAGLHGNTTAGTSPLAGSVSTDRFTNISSDGIRVITRTSAGALADPPPGTGFTVTITC